MICGHWQSCEILEQQRRRVLSLHYFPRYRHQRRCACGHGGKCFFLDNDFDLADAEPFLVDLPALPFEIHFLEFFGEDEITGGLDTINEPFGSQILSSILLLQSGKDQHPHSFSGMLQILRITEAGNMAKSRVVVGNPPGVSSSLRPLTGGSLKSQSQRDSWHHLLNTGSLLVGVISLSSA